MQLYTPNYRPSFSSSSSSEVGPVGKFVFRALLSIPVAMAAVALQIGIGTFLGSLLGAVTDAGTAVVTAAIEGVVTATVAHWAFGGVNLDLTREDRVRGFVSAALTGAAIGLVFSGFIQAIGGAGSGGAGDPGADFFPSILGVAFYVLVFAILGSVIFAIINRRLKFIGLRVAAELAEEGGKRLVEKLASESLREKWREGYNAKDDKSLALKKGFALATKWLTTCKRDNSNAIVRGIIAGTVSGAAVVQVEGFGRYTNYGFWWQVFVELFGSFTGLFGGSLILAFFVALFRYPLDLLVDAVKLALVAGVIFFLLKACTS
jgi:MFS family permease